MTDHVPTRERDAGAPDGAVERAYDSAGVERAVRELHAPRCHGMRDREGNPVDSCDHCYGPDGYNATYPCATIQALDAAIRLDRDFRTPFQDEGAASTAVSTTRPTTPYAPIEEDAE